MAKNRVLRWVTLSLVLAGFAGAAQAEQKVKDKNGVLVGNIQGWEDRSPVVVKTDGPRKVNLKVSARHFETVDAAKFTTDDCTGTAYADDGVRELGLNGMQKVIYVMKRKNKLYRTRQGVASQDLLQQSYFQFGKCNPIGGTVPLIPADVFVKDMLASYTPPFKVQ